jgi:L-cystine uptake protein TcyP (sodium:dicarboxylate symporter family)
MPYMALAVRRSSRTMAGRASAFYADRRSVESGVTVEQAPAVHVAISGGLVRMLGMIVVPIVVALIALLTGADLGVGKLLTAAILLLLVGELVAVAWVGFRWWRRRR